MLDCIIMKYVSNVFHPVHLHEGAIQYISTSKIMQFSTAVKYKSHVGLMVYINCPGVPSGPAEHTVAGQAVCSASASTSSCDRQSVQLPARRACREGGNSTVGHHWRARSASPRVAAGIGARQNPCHR